MKLSGKFSVRVLAKLHNTTWSHLALVRDAYTGTTEVVPESK